MCPIYVVALNFQRPIIWNLKFPPTLCLTAYEDKSCLAITSR
jgi:hypothetical protein